MMRGIATRWRTWLAVLAVTTGIGLLAPATAGAVPGCPVGWGSLAKSAGTLGDGPLVNVRAGQQPCYDRLVLDLGAGSSAVGYTVRYVPGVVHDGSGSPLPLRGTAFLQVVVDRPANDQNGVSTYNPANPNELVSVTGWQTFRQVAFAGSFEGISTIGLGVRARLPFRVFPLAGPGSGARLVVDVARHW